VKVGDTGYTLIRSQDTNSIDSSEQQDVWYRDNQIINIQEQMTKEFK
jgi:hypothetical protein